MRRWFALAGGGFALFAVVLGAFGAHRLETILTSRMLEVFKTGAYYQMTHGLALILLALYVRENRPNRFIKVSGWLFGIGILLFSGSLYILALSGVRQWGMVTPFGGVCFIAGWIAFLLAVSNEKSG